jgi:hypothetical protein
VHSPRAVPLLGRGTNKATPTFIPTPTLEETMKKYLFAAAIASMITGPVLAGDVGVHVGPVGAGVTTGEHHDRTVVKERAPRDRTTVIKKHDEMGNRSKTVIHHND